MNRLALALAFALTVQPAVAGPNAGQVITLTFAPGQPFATSSVHPFVAACGGPAGKATRVIEADGTRVWTFTCK